MHTCSVLLSSRPSTYTPLHVFASCVQASELWRGLGSVPLNEQVGDCVLGVRLFFGLRKHTGMQYSLEFSVWGLEQWCTSCRVRSAFCLQDLDAGLSFLCFVGLGMTCAMSCN